MVLRRITTNAQLTSERQMQIEAEIQAWHVARIAAGLPPDSSEMEEEKPGEETILYSIEDEAEVEANHRLIQERQAKADAIYDELETDIASEKATTEQPEGTEIVGLSDEE
ncbi:hypothetical protein D1007_29225 [Hordeum vulgare]|nr:hypothetical protein D1007_29225 [Hordeum vulgare]